MALDSTHLLQYLVETPTLRTTDALLQTALTEALKMARAETGLIAVFDGETGAQAGTQTEVIARYLVGLARRNNAQSPQDMRVSAATGRLGRYANLETHLPRVPTIVAASSLRQKKSQRILLIPLIMTNATRLSGVIAVLLPSDNQLELDAPDTHGLALFGQTTANTWDTITVLRNTRLDDVVLLHDVATVITSTHQLHALLQRIMALTKQLLRVDACSLLLLDPNSGELVFEFAEGDAGESIRQMRLAPGVGISGYVAQTGDPIIVNDVAQDSRFADSIDTMTGFRTRCIMCAPLRVRNRMIGVLEVINKLDGAPFTNNDLALLTSLAAQSAVAIENAQLYANLREERDRLLTKEDEVRRTLSRDLHDGPAQVVAGIAFRAEIIMKMLEADPERAREQLRELQSTAQAAARDLRTLLFGLRPLMLEKRGFIATVTNYVERLQGEAWTTHYHLEGFDPPPHSEIGDDQDRSGVDALDPTTNIALNIENALFIMVQEAVNNIKKHAYPYNVWINLTRTAKGIVIVVRDDGCGFDVAEAREAARLRGSFGLTNMEERARLIGAYYHIESQIGLGTTTTIFFPTTPLPNFTDSPGLPITPPDDNAPFDVLPMFGGIA